MDIEVCVRDITTSQKYKQNFDVSSEGPPSQTMSYSTILYSIPNERPSLEYSGCDKENLRDVIAPNLVEIECRI
jgi:hypothetical protein